MSEFAFLDTITTEDTTAATSFTEYAWDFDNNTFLRDVHGNLIKLSGNDALIIWIKKMFKVQRERFLAYSKSYGTDIPRLVGFTTAGERRSELRRYLREALMVNPVIRSVDSINFYDYESPENFRIEITLSTAFGSLTI